MAVTERSKPRPSGNLGFGGAPDAPPDQFKDFINYADTVVKRYKGTVKAYEIWNEPNNGGGFWHSACPNFPVQPCPGELRNPLQRSEVKGVDDTPRLRNNGVHGDPGLFGALTVATMNAIRGMILGADTPLLAPGGTIFLWEPDVAGRGNESGPDFMKDAFRANPQLGPLSDAVTLHGYDAYPPSSEPENNGLDLGTTNVQLGTKIVQMKGVLPLPAPRRVSLCG